MATKKEAKGGFLSGFRKELDSMDGVSTTSAPPRYWFSAGNYVQNYIMTGSFRRAIPQGRIISFAGPSGAGKSFNVASALAAAQREMDAFVFAVDSENALDDTYMQGCGVDTADDRYMYAGINTISQCQKVVSQFIKGYKAEYDGQEDAPAVVIAIDSLDMLMTETEFENYQKGIQKGDQGQRNKQLKAMLRGFVQDIKAHNITIITTSQVYKNQDVLNGEGVWIVSDAVKYAASIIVLVTKLKLKEGTEVRGIKMKCEGYKTRFTKPFQTVQIAVDYETGVDPFSGLADVAVAMGVLEKKGSRLIIAGEEKSWYEKDMAEHIDRILPLLDKKAEEKVFLKYEMKEGEQEDEGSKESVAARRLAIMQEKDSSGVEDEPIED